jgi:hypothetical protein
MLCGDDDADADDSGVLEVLLKSFLDSKHQSDDAQEKEAVADKDEEDRRVLIAGIKILQARRD